MTHDSLIQIISAKLFYVTQQMSDINQNVQQGISFKTHVVRRTRVPFLAHQKAFLEESYKNSAYPSPEEYVKIAQEIRTTPKRVKGWFFYKRKCMGGKHSITNSILWSTWCKRFTLKFKQRQQDTIEKASAALRAPQATSWDRHHLALDPMKSQLHGQ